MAKKPDGFITLKCVVCKKVISFDPNAHKRHPVYEMSTSSQSAPFVFFIPCPHCKIVNQVPCEE